MYAVPPSSERDDVPRDGAWFKNWLEARRFSNREIADLLGVTPATIWNWTRSNVELRPAIVLALEAIDKNDIEERLKTAGS